MRFALPVLLFVIAFSPLPASQDPLKFARITVADGLSQDIVTSIVQDRDGFLWFGTEYGLNRYDGYSIRVYKHDEHDSTSLSSNWIRSLLLDHNGYLWVGTSDGLDRYDSETDRFSVHLFADPGTADPSMNDIFVLSFGHAGGFFAGTPFGLYRVDETTGRQTLIQQTRVASRDFEPDYITCLLFASDGLLWVGMTKELRLFDPAKGSFIPLPQGLASLTGPVALAEDSTGKIWIATKTKGLYEWDGQNRTVHIYRHRAGNAASLTGSPLTSLLVDHQNQIWIGTWNGLDRLGAGRKDFSHYPADEADPLSLSSNRVYAVYEDAIGTLWVGTYRGGVNYSDPARQRFTHFYRVHGPPGSIAGTQVFSLCFERPDKLWIGTERGISVFETGTGQFDTIPTPPGSANEPITSLFRSRDGTMWVGTGKGHLYTWNEADRLFVSQSARFRIKGGDDIFGIRAIYEDSRGIVWIGTDADGLRRLDPADGVVTTYRTGTDFGHGLRGSGVWFISEDRDSVLWLGTFSGDQGLNRYDRVRNTFSCYTHLPGDSTSISNNAVRAMYQDSSGIFWIGTWGGGLNRLDYRSGRFSHVSERTGLSNDYVKAILPDRSGNLWISTERGITRYRMRDGAIRKFDSDDGLQRERFLTGSACAGPDGRLYFGGENGLNAFYPENIKANPLMPAVKITSVRIFEKPYSHTTVIRDGADFAFEYNQDFISFEFVALAVSTPWKVDYAYRMEGVDDSWVFSGNRRYAAYTAIPPGSYLFRVKASNSDGIWNEKGTSIRLLVRPPFWRTWWFICLAAVTIVIALYALNRYREARLIEVERLRTRIAADLHDDLASNLTSIAMFGGIVADVAKAGRQVTEEHVQLLDRITQLAWQSVGAIRDIIWAIDTRNETLDDLLQRLNDKVVGESTALGVDFRIERAGGLPRTNLSPEQRKEIWLLLKEAIHNALKHAHCSTIVLTARFESQELAITVSDDGTGFEPDGENAGRGQRTMHERAKALGGTITIRRRSQGGSEIELKARL